MERGAHCSLDEVHDVRCPAGEEEPERLAHSVAGYLRQAHGAEAFQELILVGSPAFLEELVARLPQHLADAVKARIDGDYTRLSGQQLLARIAQGH